jgi:hypothetical protein
MFGGWARRFTPSPRQGEGGVRGYDSVSHRRLIPRNGRPQPESGGRGLGLPSWDGAR